MKDVHRTSHYRSAIDFLARLSRDIVLDGHVTMQLHEFPSRLATGERAAITLRGVLVLAHGQAYLVSCMDEKDDISRSITLDHERLKALLLSSVPAYGGGPYLYCDQVIVTGTLSSRAHGARPSLLFDDIDTLTLSRRDHTFQVLP
ncbi:MAG: hypothetical protein ACT6R2_20240 [Blastomonas fulva]|jgi:hypothetical protein|uniref:hypothetical protein n=1 Tax=Pseudomonadota TaxID=1224 RepID=UPI001226D43F|nr:hypothetical protein [Variovorax sp.]TAJ67747.1 MAG: hypothetical protein EPO53_02655 [Variovorax sp.]